jgi:methyl-accepting chemotaxis protein
MFRVIRSFPRRLNVSNAILFAVALAMTLPGLVGCQSEQKQKKLAREEIEVVDPERLRVDVLNYLESIQSRYIGTMSTIAANTEDRTVREVTIRVKMSVVDIASSLMRERDARSIFVYTWAFAAASRHNSTEGTMKDAFADQQQLHVDLATAAEEEIIEIGLNHFDDEIVEEAKDDIEEIARGVSGAGLVANRDIVTEVKSNIGKDVAGLMLSPLSAFKGVASTPEAVNNIARVVDSLSNQLSLMPQRVRWEAELLTLELESLRTVSQASADITRFTDSFAVIANEIDHLPDELRSQTEDLLKNAEQLQPELRATLAQGEKTAAEIRETTQNVRQTAETIETVVPQLEKLIASANQTVLEFQPLLEAVQEMKGEPDPNKTPLDTMAVLEQSNAVTSQTLGIVTELRQLLAELKQPLGPTSSIAETKEHTRELIDAVTRRVILLIVILASAIMVVLLFHRVLLRRLLPVDQK